MAQLTAEQKADLHELRTRYHRYLAQQRQAGSYRISTDLVRLYPDTQMLDELLQQVDELKQSLDSFRPLSTTQSANLTAVFDVEYTYDSNRIEGNTLTLQETALVLQEGITIQGKSLREHLEVVNHQAALDYVRELVTGDIALTERELRTIHGLILQGIDRRHAGIYRREDVRIVGSHHAPPTYFQLQELMADYFTRYETHPVLLAVDLHQRLVYIHPFIDGNGRTARLIMNLILFKHGYPITTIASGRRAEYYTALEATHVAQDAGAESAAFRLFVLGEAKQAFFKYLDSVATNGDEEKGFYFLERINTIIQA